MNYIYPLLSTFTLPFLTIRLLRWTAWWQQKEYRLDRIITFLKTKEGKKEVTKVVNIPRNLKDLKRPVKTTKAMLIFLSALAVSLLILFNLSSFWGIILVYILCPVLIVLVSLPFWIGTELSKQFLIWKSKQLVIKHRPTIIGITGSYGKTSTRKIAVSILREKFKVWTPPKSHNTPLAVARDIVQTYQGEEIMFIEFAAYKMGEIGKICQWLPPEIALFSGLTHQHLDLFGSLEKIKQAKSELIWALPEDGTVIFNDEDVEVRKLMARFKKSKVELEAVKSKVSSLDANGNLVIKVGNNKVKTDLVGQHYAINVSLGIKLAENLKLSNKKISAGLSNFEPDENFIRSRNISTGALLIDDGGTSNPMGFEAAIKMCAEIKKKKKGKMNVLITGGIIDLGEKSKSTHRSLAEQAKQVFDLVVYTGETELDVWQDIWGDRLKSVSDLQSILSQTNKQSIILIEGKMPLEASKRVSFA